MTRTTTPLPSRATAVLEHATALTAYRTDSNINATLGVCVVIGSNVAYHIIGRQLTYSTPEFHPCSNELKPGSMSVQVSAAGRDNFLAAESDKTMALMIECCSEIKVATALLAQVQHKSPQVRAKVASHLDSLLQGERGVRLAGLLPKCLPCRII